MKLFLMIAAIAASCSFSTKAHAQALSNDVSKGYSAATRQYETLRTDTSLGCSKKLTSCPFMSGYAVITQGYYTDGNPCCSYTKLLEGQNEQEAQQLHQAEADQQNLSDVYSADSGRTDNFWGYISTANRSSNTGRLVSIDARLDACLGYGNVDTYVTSYTGCISACNDTTKNGYCTATVTNNGASDTYGVCHDRCECKYGMGGTCENL